MRDSRNSRGHNGVDLITVTRAYQESVLPATALSAGSRADNNTGRPFERWRDLNFFRFIGPVAMFVILTPPPWSGCSLIDHRVAA